MMQPIWAQPTQTGNNSPMLSNIPPLGLAMLLNIITHQPMIYSMKHTLYSLCTAASLLVATPVFAQDCYADYKAKQDNPLRLHYGVAKVSGTCSTNAARSELASRLNAQGWTLLSIISTFSKDGLAERKQSAGQYYLRF